MSRLFQFSVSELNWHMSGSALESARYHLPQENRVDFNMDIEGCCGNIGAKAKLGFCGLSVGVTCK